MIWDNSESHWHRNLNLSLSKACLWFDCILIVWLEELWVVTFRLTSICIFIVVLVASNQWCWHWMRVFIPVKLRRHDWCRSSVRVVITHLLLHHHLRLLLVHHLRRIWCPAHRHLWLLHELLIAVIWHLRSLLLHLHELLRCIHSHWLLLGHHVLVSLHILVL